MRTTPSSLALAIALLARAALADGEAPLSLRADPARLVLGTDAKTTLVVEGAGARPTLDVNLGRVANVREDRPGRWVAELIAPEQGHPQVAIVAVRDGERLAWIAVPMIGRGVAIAETRPRAPVRVTIGDATFGPVRADARGEARVPVVVPPGITHASDRGKPLDLRIPASLHVLLLADRDAAQADESARVTLTALVVNPDGSPRASAPLALAVSAGSTAEPEALAPGAYRATWSVPPGRAVDAEATATLDDEPGPRARHVLARPVGRPARLSVAAAGAVAAADASAIPLRVALGDAAGNGVDAEVALASTFGEVTTPARTGPGAWTATLHVPARLDGRTEAVVTARAAGLEDRARVRLVAGAAVTLEVAAPSAPLVADGRREARLSVRLLDRFGNAVTGVTPTVTASADGALAAEPDREGGWTLRYQPRRQRRNRDAQLSVEAAGLRRELAVPLLEPERRTTVGVRSGYAVATSGLTAAVFGADATWWPGWLAGRVGLGVDVSTLGLSRSDDVRTGGLAFSVDASARYVPVLASAAWRGPFRARGTWTAAAGAGLSRVAARVAASGEPAIVEAGFAPALSLSSTLAWRAGRHVLPFAEARLGWSGDPGLETLRGSLTTLTVGVGCRYEAF